jgi:hypothetical protein
MKVNAQYIATFFIRKGWTPNSISALLGNAQTESSINFGIYESLNSSSSTNGFGLVQWTPNSKYFNWANANGYANDHINGELNRILWEVANNQQWISTRSFPMSFKEFTQSIDSPYNLAMAFLNDYERPQNTAQFNRGTQAQTWFNTLDWSNPDAVVQPPPPPPPPVIIPPPVVTPPPVVVPPPVVIYSDKQIVLEGRRDNTIFVKGGI